jgi:hypothetical protein
VRIEAELNNVRHGSLPCDLVEVLERLVGLELKRGVGLAGDCVAAAGRAWFLHPSY